MSEPTKAEQEPIVQYEQELMAFKELLEILSTNKIELTRTERAALAFLLDAFRREYKDEWQQAFQVFLGDLEARFDAKGEEFGVALLAEETKDRYLAYITNVLAQEADPTRKTNLNILHDRIKTDWLIRHAAILENKKVPIGAVINDHNPPWYKFS